MLTISVRTRTEYAAIIWERVAQKIYELEMVQWTEARLVTGNYITACSVTKMLDDLQLSKLQERRRKAKVTMLYRIVHYLTAIPYKLTLYPAKLI